MRKYYKCDGGFKAAACAEEAVWIDITDPDSSDRTYLTDEEGVPEMFLEYLSDKDERPRVERDGQWMMTILRIPVECRAGDMPYATVPIGVISKDSHRVITLCCHPSQLTADFASHTKQKCIEVGDVAEFTLRIFYSTAYWYLSNLRTMTSDVTGAEKDLEKSIQNSDLIWLMRLQKSLVFFNTSIKGDMMVLDRIQKIFGNRLDADLVEDVDIEFRQADSTVAIYSDILEGTLNSYASIISNNVNSVMKRMSGLSIMLMVPTFVASLYGMNVDILLGGVRYAFWIIIAIAAILTAVAFIILRRLRWV